MKKKLVMKSFSLVLVLVLVVTGLFQPKYVKAANNSTGEIIDQRKNDAGEVVYELLQSGDTYYYFEKTDNRIISYSLYNNTVDYSVNDGSYIYTGKFNSSDDFQAVNKKIQTSYASTARNSLSNYSINNSSKSSTIYSASSDNSNIMNQLYGLGYPRAYSFKHVMTRKQEGYTVELYDSVSYDISETSMWLVGAGTAISFISALIGLSANTLIAIGSFILASYGVYTLARDASFTRYDITVFRMKDTYWGTVIPYSTYNNVSYNAYCGDLGATLSYEYTNGNSDYFDNFGILDTAIRNIKLYY